MARFVGPIFALLRVDWAAVVAMIAAAGAAVWALLHPLPPVIIALIALTAFAATIWSINGIIWFARRNTPIETSPSHYYGYGLAYLGVHLGFDQGNEEAMVQIGVNLANAAAHPIKYKVERFDVIVGNRTIAKPIYLNEGGIIPRGASRTYRYPSFSKIDISEFLGKRLQGSIELAIAYGHPDESPVRRLKMKIEIWLRLDDKAGISDLIISESDETV
jgi:hypothetical protein